MHHRGKGCGKEKKRKATDIMSKWLCKIGGRKFGLSSSPGCWTRRVKCSGNAHSSALSSNWLRRKIKFHAGQMTERGLKTMMKLYRLSLHRTLCHGCITSPKALYDIRYKTYTKDYCQPHGNKYAVEVSHLLAFTLLIFCEKSLVLWSMLLTPFQSFCNNEIFARLNLPIFLILVRQRGKS